MNKHIHGLAVALLIGIMVAACAIDGARDGGVQDKKPVSVPRSSSEDQREQEREQEQRRLDQQQQDQRQLNMERAQSGTAEPPALPHS
jgi:hypothetical protein